jgi:glycosyltransferase involved in cell wall biosynthesis
VRLLLPFNPAGGGVAEHVRLLALNLPARGYEVEVAGPPDAVYRHDIERAGITYHVLPYVRGYSAPLKEVRALAQVMRLVRSRRYDVIHSHGKKAGMASRPTGFVTRTPVVHTSHGVGVMGEPGARLNLGDKVGRRTVFLKFLDMLLAPLTAASISVCRSELDGAVRHHLTHASRAYLVYNGSEPCRNEVDEELRAFRGSGRLVGAVTALRDGKQVDLLVRAAPSILARDPDVRIAVVGNGPNEPALRALAATLELPAERFRFFGYEPPSCRYLSSLDAFVLPTEAEAMPLSLLEALACGVPQVCSDVGGCPEVVTAETGILVPPGRPEPIADAVVRLLADEDARRAMADASKRRHAELFSHERMVDETAQVYDAVSPSATR